MEKSKRSPRSEKIEQIRKVFSWDSTASDLKPWILVVGPPGAGKTTFIESTRRLLNGEHGGEQKYTDALQQATPGAETSIGEWNIDFNEKTVTGQNVGQVKQSLAITPKGQTISSSPSFLVLVLREPSGTSDANFNVYRESMLAVKRAAVDSGILSCLILTHILSSNDDATRFASDSDILEMAPNRVYHFGITNKTQGRRTRSLSWAEEVQDIQVLDAMTGIAQDFRQSVNNALERATNSDGSIIRAKAEMKRERPSGRKPYNSSQPTAVIGGSRTQTADETLGTLSEKCETCENFLAKNTDAHVFTVVQQKKYKFSPDCIDEFLKMACGLLNSHEGGTICVKLAKRFHVLFLQETKHKLTEMLPLKSEDSYVFKSDKKKTQEQISFVVKASEQRCRSPCTYDFNVYLPGDAGLKRITQGKFCELFRRVQRQDEFNKGDVLPPHFGKDCSRQVEYCTREVIVTYSRGAGAGETSHVTDTFASSLARCICSFATLRDGGYIYLGLSQHKEPKKGAEPSGSPPICNDNDLVWNGQYLCEGFELNTEERKAFQKQLKRDVDSMHCYSKDKRKIEDVSVSFPPVSGGSADLCLVKISVGYFHGIAWPQGHGPLAYRTIYKGRVSENVKMTFEEWVSSFTEPVVVLQEADEIRDKQKSKDTGGIGQKSDKYPATATGGRSQKQARKGDHIPPINTVDPHYFQLNPAPLRDAHGAAKVPLSCIEQFYKIVCALLNELAGGTICVHLEGSSHEVFRHQISGKLTEMLPSGVIEADTYVSLASENHVFFSVKAAARPLCTYDFKVWVSRDVGLLRPTPDQLFSLITSVQNRPEEYVPVNDPALQKDALLPRYFGENFRREMKSYTRDDIIDFTEKDNACPTNDKFAGTLVRYICALATLKRGGDIYFGVPEHKELKKSQPSGSPPGGKDDHVSTGLMVCEGIELTEEERGAFQEQLKREVDRMHCYSKDAKQIEDVSVSFLPVSGGSADLCLVKISVGYFNGIAWPQGEYPLAYKVITKDQESEIVQLSFEEWIAAFIAQ